MERKQLIGWLKAGHISIPKLFLDYYAALGLKEEEMMVLIHVHRYMEEGHAFPTPDDLAAKMTLEAKACAGHLRGLIKRGFLHIEEQEDENQVMFETYSLDPLYNQLLTMFAQETEEGCQEEKETAERELYELFEHEFSRPLSPMECETIAMWLEQDQYEKEIIHAALREAVISGKLNLRYIDRILFEWQKNGVKTVEEARKHGEKFRKYQTNRRPVQEREKTPHYPGFNWLDS
ncbi:DnaD domain-containing protein [Bacillus sp. FJAT-44742]|uniref:DnaD domain-containing protein n=1 Tax=Bacillus sp. FJAT-44742 TaxID=2014005 RepID=UPI000C239744|nr:DnaD domain-containing protein [Bacillus sp. FJAT-44742]